MLADLPTGLRHQVARATSGPAGLGLVLRDGIRIHLGDATRLGAKSEAVAVLLDRERRRQHRHHRRRRPRRSGPDETEPSPGASCGRDPTSP